jgi:cyclic beta-1,2-glucan synthetase
MYTTDVGAFGRAAALAWTQVQVQLHHLGIDRTEAGQYQRLARHIVYATPMLRPPSDIIRSGSGGQPRLWTLGISGDLPIILVCISDINQLDVAREALRRWNIADETVAVDLVIINDRLFRVQTSDRAGDHGEGQPARPRLEKRAAGHIFSCAPT